MLRILPVFVKNEKPDPTAFLKSFFHAGRWADSRQPLRPNSALIVMPHLRRQLIDARWRIYSQLSWHDFLLPYSQTNKNA